MEPTYNFLDAMVDRFREQWETNPAYRARMSGVVGLAAIMGLCSCALIFSLVANSVFASVGLGGGGAGGGPSQQQGGGGLANVIPTFATDAVPTWSVSGSPAVQVVPTSGTPAPTATVPPTETAVATATQCFSNCGGHGGGGPSVTISVTGWTPYKWTGCSSASPCTVTVHTSVPNVGAVLNITGCNGVFYTTIVQGTTDANGNLTFTGITVGAGTAKPTANIQPIAQGDNGTNETRGYPPC